MAHLSMAILAQYLSEKEADAILLVLSASGISHWIEEGESGFCIFVKDQEFTNAKTVIDKCVYENITEACIASGRERVFLPSHSAIWICSILVAIHVAITLLDNKQEIFQLYGASASKILNGDLYRTVTALMLHSGIFHLMANLVGLTVFGTALCGVTGWGVGWSLIALSGVIGNLLNAWFYKTGHLSLGASTALFGAMGLVAVEHVIWKIREGHMTRAWLPIGAGLALLGFMGASQQVDLMAHFFGFFAGSFISMLYFLYIFKPILRGQQAQVRCAIVLGIVAVGSWLTPLLKPHVLHLT